MDPSDLAYQTAQLLLEVGAVALRPGDPFRFASGLFSPIYCDNRVLISYPRQRSTITQGFAQLLQKRGLQTDVIAGTATAGIPHAAWLAAELGLPMVYVRSRSKGHGKEQWVEGVLQSGQSVIVVEDLVTTGGSVLKTVRALRQYQPATAQGEKSAAIQVEHVLSIFSYGFPETAETFAQEGVRLHSLTTLPALLEVAIEEGYLSADERSLVEDWATDPAGWSQAREQHGPE